MWAPTETSLGARVKRPAAGSRAPMPGFGDYSSVSLSHWCVGLPGLEPYLLFPTTLATAMPVPTTKWSMALEKSIFP